MSRERGTFDHYMEEKRSATIAQAGRMEEMGFNMRGLKKHIEKVDGVRGVHQLPREKVVFESKEG